MAAKYGLNAKAYRLTTGTRATWGTITAGIASGAAPSNLDEMTTVKNVGINIQRAEADVSTRGSTWGVDVASVKKASVSIEAPWDPADTDMQALVKAHMANTSIALAILDGDKATSGVQGLWADFDVTGMDKTENLEEGQMVSFTLKPCPSAVAPEWVQIA